jgi:hypothetical protein
MMAKLYPGELSGAEIKLARTRGPRGVLSGVLPSVNSNRGGETSDGRIYTTETLTRGEKTYQRIRRSPAKVKGKANVKRAKRARMQAKRRIPTPSIE